MVSIWSHVYLTLLSDEALFYAVSWRSRKFYNKETMDAQHSFISIINFLSICWEILLLIYSKSLLI